MTLFGIKGICSRWRTLLKATLSNLVESRGSRCHCPFSERACARSGRWRVTVTACCISAKTCRPGAQFSPIRRCFQDHPSVGACPNMGKFGHGGFLFRVPKPNKGGNNDKHKTSSKEAASEERAWRALSSWFFGWFGLVWLLARICMQEIGVWGFGGGMSWTQDFLVPQVASLQHTDEHEITHLGCLG